MTEMNSSRPYLVRALYEWILDNQCTPYLLVNAEYPDTAVPAGFVEDGAGKSCSICRPVRCVSWIWITTVSVLMAALVALPSRSGFRLVR